MAIKKWYWILAAACVAVLALVLLAGMGEHTISNSYFIPAGVFNPFMGGNHSTEPGMRSTVSREGDPGPAGEKLMDGNIAISEWNRSIPKTPQRNITVLHVTDEDFREYPDLQQGMNKAKHTPPRNDGGWLMSITGFNANQSDFYTFMESVCHNKPRPECYADLPVFEYEGRYYVIDIAIF